MRGLSRMGGNPLRVASWLFEIKREKPEYVVG